MAKFLPFILFLFLFLLAPAHLQAAANDGFSKFALCAACHGAGGEGTNLGPPLAGSEWVNGPAENLIRIQLRGLQGPIRVKGVDYNFPGGMPPLGYQTDEDIAAVLSFVRSSFGNQAPAITAAEVAALRKEPSDKPITAAELVTPSAAIAATSKSPGKYDHLDAGSSIPTWVWLSGVALAAGGAFVLLRRS